MICCLFQTTTFVIIFCTCSARVYILLSLYLLVARGFSFLTDLAKRGIVLPKVSKPVGNYVSVLRTGNVLYLCMIRAFSPKVVAGALPMKEDGSYYKGKVYINDFLIL